jgi:parallel beta-helix repeat protein
VTNNVDGIVLKESSNNRISGNRVVGNAEYGIRVYSNSQGNIVSDNIIESNAADGVSVAYSTSNTISRNQVTNNQANGVSLSNAQDNDIVGNNVTLNKVCGVQLRYDASNTNVSRNYLSKNGLGILVETVGNIITENMIIENNGWGIRLTDSQRDNVIHHNNFINNTVAEGLQVSMPATRIFGSYDSGEGPIWTAGNPNMWDDGKEGNYWSDYMARYPHASEVNNTHVGDTPFFINENNIDRYPLMVPFEISLPSNETSSTQSPETQPEPESFPTTLVIASAASVTTVTAGLLFYFKKRKH